MPAQPACMSLVVPIFLFQLLFQSLLFPELSLTILLLSKMRLAETQILINSQEIS